MRLGNDLVDAGAGHARRGVGAWAEVMGVGLVVICASHALPLWIWLELLPPKAMNWMYSHQLYEWFFDGVMLVMGLVLALPTWRRSGICVGRLGGNWWKVVGVMAVPVVLTAVVYPLLGTQPFGGMSASMWVVSPLAQDVIFAGYLYGRFERLAGRWVHPRVPLNGALVITTIYFVLWHVPNFGWMPAGYVVFQLCYVFVGTVWTGMTRVWTGSILYIVVVHMVVNGIAWWAS